MLRLKYTNLSLAFGLLWLIFTVVTGNPIDPAKARDEPSATQLHWIHGLPHLSVPLGKRNPAKPRDQPLNTEPQHLHAPPPPGRSTPPGFSPGTIPGRYFAHPTKAAEKRHPPLEVGVDLLGHGPADVHIPEAAVGKRIPPSDLDSLGRVNFEAFNHDPLEDREMTRFQPGDPLPSKTLTGETPLLSAAGDVHSCSDDPTKACFMVHGQPVTLGSWVGATGQPALPSKPVTGGNSFPDGPNPDPSPATLATAGNVFTDGPNPATELVTAVKRILPPNPPRPAKTLTGENPLLSAAADVHPCSADPSKACFILNGQPVTVGNWIPTGAATQPSPAPKGAQPGAPPAGTGGQSPLPSAVVYPVQCSADADMACIYVAGQPVTVGTWEPTGATTQPSPPPMLAYPGTPPANSQTPLPSTTVYVTQPGPLPSVEPTRAPTQAPPPSTTSQIAQVGPPRKHHPHPHPHPPPSFITVTISGKSGSEIGTITVITDGKGPETGSFTVHAGTVTLTATAEPPTPTDTSLHVHATYFGPLNHIPKRDVHPANEIAARTHTVKTTHHAKHCHTTINVARPHDFDIPPTETIWTWTTFTYLTVDCGDCTLVTKDPYKPTPPPEFTATITATGSTISTGYTCKQTYEPTEVSLGFQASLCTDHQF